MYCAICGTEIKEVVVCDVVFVDNKYFYEEVVSPVLSKEALNIRKGKIFDYDEFKKAIAKKYNCSMEDVKSNYIDGIEIPETELKKLGKTEEDLGCRCPFCQDFM